MKKPRCRKSFDTGAFGILHLCRHQADISICGQPPGPKPRTVAQTAVFERLQWPNVNKLWMAPACRLWPQPADWQLLHDLQAPAQQAGYRISLLPLEATASFSLSGRRFCWFDDEPVDVCEFVAAFASCFSPNVSVFRLSYFPEEEGEEIVCVLMNSQVASRLRQLLGEGFDQNFVALSEGNRLQFLETNFPQQG